MTSTTDSTGIPLSPDLDNVFTPPSRQQWAEMAVAGLNTEQSTMDALQQLRRTTLEGIAVEVLYDSADLTLNLASGKQPPGTWDNRLCVRAQNGTEASSAIMEGLNGGITSIELHTSSPDVIQRALDSVKLDLATVSLRSAGHHERCTQALINVAKAQGLSADALKCSVNTDPLHVALADKSTQSDFAASQPGWASFVQSTASQLPSSQCVLVDVALHHNAGASAVEELHAALATATVYLEALVNTGMSVDEACAQIVFQVAMDADVLLGVAKLRALRALWQRVVAEFDTPSALSHPTCVVAETSQRFLSRLQPWNNHLRNLCAGTAAILGGADTLMVHPHDALQRTTEAADTSLGDRMARNVAIILERECGLAKVQDPMAGSYAIENLTTQLMQHAWQSLATTDTSEGWVDELLSGRWQARLSATHTQRIALMQQEQRIAVGVNRFVQSDETANVASHPDDTNQKAHALARVREAESFEQAADQEASL